MQGKAGMHFSPPHYHQRCLSSWISLLSILFSPSSHQRSASCPVTDLWLHLCPRWIWWELQLCCREEKLETPNFLPRVIKMVFQFPSHFGFVSRHQSHYLPFSTPRVFCHLNPQLDGVRKDTEWWHVSLCSDIFRIWCDTVIYC